MADCSNCGFNNADNALRCEKCASELLGIDLRCGLYTYAGSSIGQVLQMRYIIVRELSSDFTGVKFLSQDAQENKDVIIWALPSIDASKTQPLCALCDSLKQLNDEHIINVSGFDSHKNTRYVVTDYIDGCTLAERIASHGPLNIEEAIEIFTPLARSIDSAHSQGFVHGDICPSNIILDSKSGAKLANFGISYEIKKIASQLMQVDKISALHYAAPEQLENEICLAQSDIYSFAASFCQSLFAEPVSLNNLLQGQPATKIFRRQQIEILRKALSAEPHQRPDSAGELLAAISNDKSEIINEQELIDTVQILKQNILEQKTEYEDKIRELITESEKEKENLVANSNQARILAEQQRADYENIIAQLKNKICEAEARLSAVLNETNNNEDKIHKLKAEAENEKQRHIELLNHTQAQASQQQADYEKLLQQLTAKIKDTEAKLTASLNEVKSKEEKINKLAADAEAEKQHYIALLNLANAQAGQHQLAHEKLIEQLKAKIEELQAQFAAVSKQANQNIESLTLEKQRALQKNNEYEKQLAQAKKDIAARIATIKQIEKSSPNPSKPKTRLIPYALAAIVIFAVAMGFWSVNMRGNLGAGRIHYQSFQDLIKQADGFEAAGQWEQAIAAYNEAVKINKTAKIQNKIKSCRYNSYLSQAIKAHQDESPYKALELYTHALTYKNNLDTYKKSPAPPQNIIANDEPANIAMPRTPEPATGFENKQQLPAVPKTCPEKTQPKDTDTTPKITLASQEEPRLDNIQSLKLAAKQGNAAAGFELGLMYYSGLEIEKDYNQALEYFVQSAQAGNGAAMFNAARMYHQGIGIQADFIKAMEWYDKAADKDITQAMNYLAQIYYSGLVVKKDFRKAAWYYQRSANLGDLTGTYNFAIFYRNGIGVKKDNIQAAQWFTKAALAGDVDSMYQLGLTYQKGIGVKKDMQTAIHWFQLAARSGHELSKKNLVKLGKTW